MSDEKKVPSSVESQLNEIKKEVSGADKSKVAPKPVAKPVVKQIPVVEKLVPEKDWQKDLTKELGTSVIESYVSSGEFTIVVLNDDKFLDNLTILKEKDFDYLSDISSVDYLNYGDNDKRFALSYHLYSLNNNVRLRIKVLLDEAEAVPSVMEIWKTADFHEREAFDLMGIGFSGREGLKRILLPDDWIGHPLRKDYKKDQGRDEYTAKLIRQFKEDE